jgi:hypothetical protein
MHKYLSRIIYFDNLSKLCWKYNDTEYTYDLHSFIIWTMIPVASTKTGFCNENSYEDHWSKGIQFILDI